MPVGGVRRQGVVLLLGLLPVGPVAALSTPAAVESASVGQAAAASDRRASASVGSASVGGATTPGSGPSGKAAWTSPGLQLGLRDWFGRPATEPVGRTWQRQKNPTVAMVSSFLVPGLGQLYNEREFWSVVAAGVHFYFLGDIIVEQRLANRYRTLKNLPVDPNDPASVQAQQEAEVLFLLYRDNRIQSTWLLGLTLLLSGLQCYVDAHLFDFDAGASLQFVPSFGAVQGGALRLRF